MVINIVSRYTCCYITEHPTRALSVQPGRPPSLAQFDSDGLPTLILKISTHRNEQPCAVWGAQQAPEASGASAQDCPVGEANLAVEGVLLGIYPVSLGL